MPGRQRVDKTTGAPRLRSAAVAGKDPTMTLLTRVREFIGDGAVYECRHCGTTLESEIDDCSVCGTSGVARYEIE